MNKVVQVKLINARYAGRQFDFSNYMYDCAIYPRLQKKPNKFQCPLHPKRKAGEMNRHEISCLELNSYTKVEKVR